MTWVNLGYSLFLHCLEEAVKLRNYNFLKTEFYHHILLGQFGVLWGLFFYIESKQSLAQAAILQKPVRNVPHKSTMTIEAERLNFPPYAATLCSTEK